jgi:hypothetical protein
LEIDYSCDPFAQEVVSAVQVTHPELWRLIEAWPLHGSAYARPAGTPPSKISFAQSLAREQDLFRLSAEGVENEYRRWLYLCAAQGKRMQGSNWMAKAERHHRIDAANWQALTEALPANCLDGFPAPRSRENGAAYAETLASYQDTFVHGPVFPKVWPARWREDLGIWPVLWSLIAIMFGVALKTRGSETLALPGGLIFVLGVFALLVGISTRPWQNDDQT